MNSSQSILKSSQSKIKSSNSNLSVRSTQQNKRKSSYLQTFHSKDYMSIISQTNLQLQEYMLNIDKQIKRIIQTRESSYRLSFEIYNKKVHKKLIQIKNMFPIKQLNKNTQEIIEQLQREVFIFRQETLRYFYLLEEKDEEIKMLKRQLMLCKEELQISNRNKKLLMKKVKQSNSLTKIFIDEEQTGLMHQQKEIKQEAIQNLSKEKQNNKQTSSSFQKLKTFKYVDYEPMMQSSEKKFRKTLLSLDMKNSDEYYKKTSCTSRSKRMRTLYTDNTSNQQSQLQKNENYIKTVEKPDYNHKNIQKNKISVQNTSKKVQYVNKNIKLYGKWIYNKQKKVNDKILKTTRV